MSETWIMDFYIGHCKVLGSTAISLSRSWSRGFKFMFTPLKHYLGMTRRDQFHFPPFRRRELSQQFPLFERCPNPLPKERTVSNLFLSTRGVLISISLLEKLSYVVTMVMDLFTTSLDILTNFMSVNDYGLNSSSFTGMLVLSRLNTFTICVGNGVWIARVVLISSVLYQAAYRRVRMLYLFIKFSVETMTSDFSNADTGVFWDVMDCPIPDDYDPISIHHNIKSVIMDKGFRKLGSVEIKVYGEKNKNQDAFLLAGIPVVTAGDKCATK